MCDEELIQAKERLKHLGHDVGVTHVLHEGSGDVVKITMDDSLFTRDEIIQMAIAEKALPGSSR